MDDLDRRHDLDVAPGCRAERGLRRHPSRDFLEKRIALAAETIVVMAVFAVTKEEASLHRNLQEYTEFSEATFFPCSMQWMVRPLEGERTCWT